MGGEDFCLLQRRLPPPLPTSKHFQFIQKYPPPSALCCLFGRQEVFLGFLFLVFFRDVSGTLVVIRFFSLWDIVQPSMGNET